ncbi:serine/threonine protein kinase [Pseudenhygromyxa sp. WMMC2535]|uniref:serine/threonine protein kinase n=1 Tax=Pseudenhygromyxa sp. WMMC2535 TaxID=2712867 RepID=UPI001556EF24|nr:serine/threonine-protein kinase [Pseudenhygromyxa sp. WMMC2535]NVB41949.1 serine/threonine protein kinase [Pseudenhygromyxa sp. WMMC2535]
MASEPQDRSLSTKEREVLESEVISGDPSADLFGTAPTMPGGSEPQISHSGRRGDRSGELVQGRYHLLRELGRGGMGTVYLAERTDNHETFAIKLLNERYLERGDIADRFIQEAQAVSRIDHPNVVSITDFGRLEDGTTFLVMEHLQGESLAALCKREAPLPWPRVRHIMLQICDALQAAHDAAVIHRDIKPDNILRLSHGDDPDFIKVLDFGLAKLQGGGLRLTRTGMVIGTPEYMAPEQARGLATDHLTDVYSAGIVMYELLCGTVPFKSKSFVGMRNKHLLTPPQPPSARTDVLPISEEADAIVLRALAKDPAHRFASMTEMAAAIEDVGTGKGPVVLIENPTLQLGGLAESSLIGRKLSGSETSASSGSASLSTRLSAGLDIDAEPDSRGLSPALLMILGGAALAIAAIVAALVIDGMRRRESAAPPTATSTNAAATAKLVADPPPDAAEDATAPTSSVEVDHVVLRFLTPAGGPIEVLDAEGERVGLTDAHGELIVPQSDAALHLILRAEGFADHPLETVPDRDRSFQLKLEPSE